MDLLAVAGFVQELGEGRFDGDEPGADEAHGADRGALAGLEHLGQVGDGVSVELGLTLVSEYAADPKATLEATCSRCGTERRASWSTIASAPPCLSCDGRRLDPQAPHRLYLFKFPSHRRPRGVKVGINHSVDDRRLTQHVAAGGELVQVVDVANRATAFAAE